MFKRDWKKLVLAMTIFAGSISTAASAKSDQKIIIVGNEQAESMYSVIGSAGCTWYFNRSADYKWMESALSKIEEDFSEHTTVVIMVDDQEPVAASSYASLINEKAKEWDARGIETVCVSPDNNQLLQSILSENVTYISSGDSFEDVDSTDTYYKNLLQKITGAATGLDITDADAVKVEGVSGSGSLTGDGGVVGVTGSTPGEDAVVEGVSGFGTLEILEASPTVTEETIEEDPVVIEETIQPVIEDTKVPGVEGSNEVTDIFNPIIEIDNVTIEQVESEMTEVEVEEPVSEPEPVIYDEDEENMVDSTSSTEDEDEPEDGVLVNLDQVIDESQVSIVETESVAEDALEQPNVRARRGTVADTEAQEATPQNIGWIDTDSGKQYYTDDGTLVTGKEQIEGTWYFFDENGVSGAEGLHQTSEGIVCTAEDGSIVTGWQTIADDRYYFLPNGNAAIGYTEIDGEGYYFSKQGKLCTGKFTYDGVNYVADEEGHLQLGWVEWNGDTYYATEDGLKVGNAVIDGSVYFFNENGVLQKEEQIGDLNDTDLQVGWNETSYGRVYYREDGVRLTGWKKIQGEIFFFDRNGIALTELQEIDGRFFEFDENGVLQGGLAGSANVLNNLFMQEETDLLQDSADAEGEKEVHASYEECFRGDLFDPSKVQVILVDSTGVGTLITTYTVGDEISNPREITGDLMLTIETIYGKTDLVIHPQTIVKEAEETKSEDEIQVSYDGEIYEGDRPRATLIHAYVEQKDGTKEELQIDEIEGDLSSPLMETRELVVKTASGEEKLTIKPIAISYIEPDVTGVKRLGDTINPENVVIGYEDGTFRKVPIKECEFGIQPSEKVLGEGQNEFPMLWKDKEYVMTLTALGIKESTEEVNIEATTSGTGIGKYAADDLSGVTLRDLGVWRITAYADTPADQGPYVGKTASGAPLVAGRTVAVSEATMTRLGLSFGDRIVVNGHIYTIEDHGDRNMYNQNWVDIFVDDPSLEYMDFCNGYSSVYLVG
ncbi:MAG: hypothetical protein Q4B26_00420 [Eubacteriales bacterium]|nr:hypothetical protein [Eubacteriales bacterium]